MFDIVLKGDLRLEHGARTTLKAGIAHCQTVQDYVSRGILVDILDDPEEHIDHVETQLGLIDQIGLQNFLQNGMYARRKNR